ncbi:MAG: hypothetical protein M1839_003008 [Geoglossum umbratile]|nr:MAG: hypothetical protein M1839_003008 [Geoglossum umbratile]
MVQSLKDIYMSWNMRDKIKPAIDHVTARKVKQEFFKPPEPWKSELSNTRDRFGALALQNYLFQTPTKLIQRRLPDIKARVTKKAERKLMDLRWSNVADRFAENITSSRPRLKLLEDTAVTPKQALAGAPPYSKNANIIATKGKGDPTNYQPGQP